MKVRRGGEPIDLGPTDGRNWLDVLPFETCNKRGHSMTPENTVRTGPYVQCRQCKEEANTKLVECAICGATVTARHLARHVERIHRKVNA